MIHNDRSYLTEQLYKSFGEIDVYIYHDLRGDKDCYVVENFSQENLTQEFLEFYNAQADNTHQNVANIAGDAVVLCHDRNIIMFKDTPPGDIRTVLQHDFIPRNYTLVFKTASVHSYAVLINENTGEAIYFGAGGRNNFDFLQPGFLRDDEVYDKKYYHGDDFIVPGKMPHSSQSSSLSMSLGLTDEEVTKMQYMILEHKQYYENANAMPYDLMYHNCAYFLYLVYNATFNHSNDEEYSHYYLYMVADELDFRDVGIYYNFMLTDKIKGLVEFFPTFVDNLLDFYQNHHGLADVGSAFYLQAPFFLRPLLPDFGNTDAHIAAANGKDIEAVLNNLNALNDFHQTPLHLALRFEKFGFVKEMIEKAATSLNVNAVDYQNMSPLDYILQTYDKNKGDVPGYRELTHYLIEHTTNLNEMDYPRDISPLIIAAKNGDLLSVKDLIEHDADYEIKDQVGNNILHITYYNRDKAAAEKGVDPNTQHSEVLDYLLNSPYYQALHVPNIEGDLPEVVWYAKTIEERYPASSIEEFAHHPIINDPAMLDYLKGLASVYPEPDTIMNLNYPVWGDPIWVN